MPGFFTKKPRQLKTSTERTFSQSFSSESPEYQFKILVHGIGKDADDIWHDLNMTINQNFRLAQQVPDLPHTYKVDDIPVQLGIEYTSQRLQNFKRYIDMHLIALDMNDPCNYPVANVLVDLLNRHGHTVGLIAAYDPNNNNAISQSNIRKLKVPYAYINQDEKDTRALNHLMTDAIRALIRQKYECYEDDRPTMDTRPQCTLL